MPVSRPAAAVLDSLASALAQGFGDFELLIGDDGADRRVGGTAPLRERIADPRVEYVENSPPLGFAANHEALLARARGELIAFLHDDDRWEPGYLGRAVAALEAEPGAGFVLTAHRELPGGRVWRFPAAGDGLAMLLDARVRLLPSATVMRRAALKAVRSPWPPLSCGDMVLYLDAAAAGWGVATVEDPLVAYVRHPGQISAAADGFRRDLAQLLGLYRFDDPTAERIRRRRLAGTWLSVARAELREGRSRPARAAVRRGLEAGPSAPRIAEGAVLTALALCPPLARLALRSWYAVRGVPATEAEGPR